MVYSRGRVHIVYPLHFEGADIFYTVSTDGGLTWAARARLSAQDGHAGQLPSAHADSAGNLIAAWFDYKYGSMCGLSGDILTRTSTDNGQTWLSECRVTDTQSGFASSCFVLDSTFHAVWADEWPFGCGYAKILYSFSRDWGKTWAEPQLISGNYMSRDRDPFIVGRIMADTVLLHCFWGIYTGDVDLHYASGRYVVTSAAEGYDANLPDKVRLSAHPNPFNSSTVITYSHAKGGEIKITNSLGQIIRSFEAGASGEGRIGWDGADQEGHRVSSGVYMIKLQTGNRSRALKLVLVR